MLYYNVGKCFTLSQYYSIKCNIIRVGGRQPIKLPAVILLKDNNINKLIKMEKGKALAVNINFSLVYWGRAYIISYIKSWNKFR